MIHGKAIDSYISWKVPKGEQARQLNSVPFLSINHIAFAITASLFS